MMKAWFIGHWLRTVGLLTAMIGAVLIGGFVIKYSNRPVARPLPVTQDGLRRDHSGTASAIASSTAAPGGRSGGEGGRLSEGSAVMKKAQYGAAAGKDKLLWIQLLSEVAARDVRAIIRVGGLPPDALPINLTYRLLFDTDGDGATGRAVAGFSGIDKEVLIRIAGEAAKGPPAISAVVMDDDTGGKQTSLPRNPRLTRSVLYRDPLPPERLEHEGEITLDIPKSLLNLSVASVPVGLVAEDGSGAIQDTLKLVFDQEAYTKEPTVTLAPGKATAGQTVRFSMQGFPSGAAFTLLFDNTPLLTGSLDGAGKCAGRFVVPDAPPGNHFVTAKTARENGFKYGFNVITIMPPQ